MSLFFCFCSNLCNYLFNTSSILYTFFIFCLVIWVSLTIEATMSKVTKNQKELEELRIANTQKVYELVSLSTRASVSGRLSVMGSELKEPETPAYNIKK